MISSMQAFASPAGARDEAPPRSWTAGWVGPVVALGSGLAYATAFPPLGWSPVVWVALAPFFAVAASSPPGRAALAGLCWGFGVTAGTAPWLPELIGRYFELAPEVRLATAAVASVGIVGGYTAVFGTVLSRFGPQAGVLPVAAAWMLCEWARVRLLVPNPWALTAYGLPMDGALVQAADLAGPWGLGALVAAVNAALAGALLGRVRLRELVAVAAALGAAWGYGAWRLHTVPIAEPTLRVAVVQIGHAPQSLETLADSQRNLVTYAAATREAVRSYAPDWVVWPEGAADFRPDGRTTRARDLLRLSRALGAGLLVGAPREEAGRAYNALFALSRGRIAGTADKVELMPFSEAQPLGGWLPLGNDRLSPGELRLIRISDAHRAGSLLCSEAMLPSQARAVVRAGADVLVNPSNDVWFGAASASEQQLVAARFRAIETRRSLVRATPTGLSALIDPRGAVVKRGPIGGEAVLVAELPTGGGGSPYLALGDGPSVGLALIALVASLGWSRA